MNVQPFMRVVQAHYHRMLAGVGVAAFLVVGSYAGWRVTRLAAEADDFKRRIGDMKPEHPAAKAVDMTAYQVALDRLGRPVQMGAWTNSLLVPATRVWCVDCRRPIPFEAMVCSGCGKKQPDFPGTNDDRGDQDRDGMTDAWEKQHGLNPGDPSDRDRDADDDLFTNWEEYSAAPQTDPRDPASHPPIARKLCLAAVRAEPFKLLFTSVSKLPDGGAQFALNTIDGARTFFVKIGDTVMGWTVEKYEERFVTERLHGAEMPVNRSVLTLRQGDKTVALEIGRRRPPAEMQAVLKLAGDASEFVLKEGDAFKVKDKEYRLIRIDTRGSGVLLEQLSTKERMAVGRCDGSAPKDAAPPVAGP